eukprot:175620_1
MAIKSCDTEPLEYITVIDKNDPIHTNIQRTNKQKLISTKNDTYVNAFICQIRDPSLNPYCCSYCTLWFGGHIWLILYIISGCYNIYFSIRSVLHILEMDCESIINNGSAIYDDYYYYFCSLQNEYHSVGFTSKIIYCSVAMSIIGLLFNFIAFHGIYKCSPNCILSQVIYFILLSINDAYWIITVGTYSNIIGIIFRIFPTYVLLRIYQWANYYKNGTAYHRQ